MALVLAELPITAKVVKTGDDRASLVAADYLQIRHGTLANPTVMLQEQVPQGKKWEIRIYVGIDETDA